jgi:DNA replication and repair protein RecF
MIVRSVRLETFRNYLDETVELSPGINILTGLNAQGKTNLLEGIFLLSCGHGFRTRFDSELIAFGNDSALVSGSVFSAGREQEIQIGLTLGVRKRVFVNGVKRNAAELSELLRVVLFSPGDLNMIKDGAQARRRFMDMAISQLRPAYAKLLAEYARLYEHKRRILRDWREKPALLDALDDFSDGLCRCGAQIVRYRAAFVQKLTEAAIPIHAEFSGRDEVLSLAYQTAGSVKDPFALPQEICSALSEHQKAHRQAELASGNVLSGIHKDELEIGINGSSARLYASQGQTRTAALSLKMAERALSLKDTGDCPILLLDDVLSELDEKRQEFVLSRIGGGQTLITCCEDSRVRKRTAGRIIGITGGRTQALSGPEKA